MRRTPGQERSRAMVERIVTAAARVLAEDGYEAASTNRIAAAAGVSPGSLYQYFSDRDAVLDRVTDDLVSGFAGALTPVLRDVAGAPPEDAVETVVWGVLEALEPHAALLRGLVDRVPATRQDAALEPVRRRLADVTLMLLASQRDRLAHDDLERTTWVAVELTRHLVVRYVLDQPRIGRAAFVDDVSRMLRALAYADAGT